MSGMFERGSEVRRIDVSGVFERGSKVRRIDVSGVFVRSSGLPPRLYRRRATPSGTQRAPGGSPRRR